jgi:hypothetical protein
MHASNVGVKINFGITRIAAVIAKEPVVQKGNF